MSGGGQFDGDGPFSGSMQALPAFFGGSPPWHLWGNTQTIETIVELPSGVSGILANPGIGQMVKVGYKRPTSWNWIFSSKLISGVNNGSLTDDLAVRVEFELTVGIGRSFIQMAPQLIFASSSAFSPAFEVHSFQFGSQFPRNAQVWSTKTTSPTRTFIINPVGTPPTPDAPTTIDNIVAQDIQLVTRVFANTLAPNTALGGRVVVEVSSQFAPLVHVRPDWFRDNGDAVRFGGNEIGGT